MNSRIPKDPVTSRRPHAVLDLASRQLKAVKIERLLNLRPREQPLRLLEIGCGSGGISHYFAMHPVLNCVVDAVDVVDNRQIRNGYSFHLVDGVQLPFPDGTFDVVITNHVIEHLGEMPQQAAHLGEIRRVINPRGVGYLAVPNRWQIIEPHYRLAFLSWMPRPLRTPYLKTAGRGNFYDCEPLNVPDLEHLLAGAGFSFNNSCIKAARLMLELERPGAVSTSLVTIIPDICFRPLKRLIPTLVYVFHPRGA